MQAAEEVFGELGYHEASVAEIVRKAGVAQGTFYIHFKGKREIFAELLRRINHLIRTRSSEASKGAKTFVEAERLGFEAFFRFVIERPDIRLIWEAEFVDPGCGVSIRQRSSATGRVALPECSTRRARGSSTSRRFPGACSELPFAALRWPYWTVRPFPKSR